MKPRAQGRGATAWEQVKAAEKAFDAKMRDCSRPTRQPRPAWLEGDKSALPMRPPGRPS